MVLDTETNRRIRYAMLSWDYDFPEYVESALEEDFVEHPGYYDEFSVRRVAALLLIEPNPDLSLLLECARNRQPNSHNH